MKHLFLRLYYKFLRSNSSTKEKMCTIQGGPLKGYLFSLKADDNRYQFGIYEAQNTDQFIQTIQSNFTVYDLGANAGYMSLLFSKLAKQVYCFEPMPANLEILHSNIESNNISNISVYPYAISNENTVLEFPVTDNKSAYTYVKDSANYKDSIKAIQIQGYKLDTVIEEKNLDPPNLIKIDVEGAEYDVLHGAKKTLQEHKPIILLATHDLQVAGIKDKCISFLKGLGYTCIPTGDLKHEEQVDFICTCNAS